MWLKIYPMNSIPDERVLLFDSKDAICQNNQFNLSFILKSESNNQGGVGTRILQISQKHSARTYVLPYPPLVFNGRSLKELLLLVNCLIFCAHIVSYYAFQSKIHDTSSWNSHNLGFKYSSKHLSAKQDVVLIPLW